MSIYVGVNESPPAPIPVRIGTANLLIFGFDDDNDGIVNENSAPFNNSGIDSTRVMKVTSWADFQSAYSGVLEDTPLKKAVEDYFNEEAGQGADPANIFCYRFKEADSGDTIIDEVAIRATVDSKSWRTFISPCGSISGAKVSYAGGEGVSQAGGYDVETDDAGLYSGKITFKEGFPKNGDGEYQALTDEDLVLISYTTAGIAEAFRVCRMLDAQFVMLGYDHGKMTGDTPAEGIYGGVSFVDDIASMLAFCNQCCSTGFFRMGLISLPAESHEPSSSTDDYGGGGGETWSGMREQLWGNNRNAIVCGLKQTPLETGDYLGEFDGAAILAAMIRKNPVGKDVKMTVPIYPIEAYENESTEQAFKQARILTIVKASHLSEGTWLNFGFTLGVGTDRWINFVRSKYQIKHSVQAGLLNLMLQKDLSYVLDGGFKIISRITAIIEDAKIKRWCDGLKSIKVPIMAYMQKTRRTQSEQDYLDMKAEAGIFEGIEIEYIKGANVDRIEISNLSEVLS